MLPGFLFEDVSHEIVFMQALHNNNDAALLLVIQPAVQSVIKPLVHSHPLGL